MNLSLYEASVPAYIAGLDEFLDVIDQAERYVASGAAARSAILETPIADRFLPFGLQVVAACDHARNDTARVLGEAGRREAPREMTFDALRSRAAATIGFLRGVDVSTLNQAAASEIAEGDETFSGFAFILHHSLPHFYFHLATAYLILRHFGVAVAPPVGLAPTSE